MEQRSISCVLREMQTDLLECTQSKTLTTPNTHEDMQQQELAFIADENVKQYRQFGREFSNFLENETYPSNMFQQSYSSVFPPKELKTTSQQKPARGCL